MQQEDRPPLPLLVVTTVATRDDALAIARALVELRLAACAQVEAIESVYRWQGAVQQEAEFRLLVKTTPARYADVEAAIRQRHPYQLPAIHAVATAAAHAAYAAWVEGETAPRGEHDATTAQRAPGAG